MLGQLDLLKRAVAEAKAAGEEHRRKYIQYTDGLTHIRQKYQAIRKEYSLLNVAPTQLVDVIEANNND